MTDRLASMVRIAFLAGLNEGFARKMSPLSLSDLADFALQGAGGDITLGDLLTACQAAGELEENERRYGGSGKHPTKRFKKSRNLEI